MKQQYLQKALLVLLLPLFAFVTAHKFYVSVTNIDYSEKDDALQITSRIFIDDLEEVLLERYGDALRLNTEEESDRAEAIIERYVRGKLTIELNGQPTDFTYLGRQYEADIITLYMEVPDIGLPDLQSISIQNEMLTDLFDEQKNIVHLTVGERKKSMVLVRERPKGMLNL